MSILCILDFPLVLPVPSKVLQAAGVEEENIVESFPMEWNSSTHGTPESRNNQKAIIYKQAQ
jgi:hypothetical protein